LSSLGSFLRQLYKYFFSISGISLIFFAKAPGPRGFFLYLEYMLKTYFVVAWRNLRKNKVYSTINITGLAIGMAVGLLIGLWVWDETTANHSFPNHGQLAEIVSITTQNGTAIAEEDASVPTCAELKNKFPDDIKDAALFAYPSPLLTVGDKKISSWGLWTQKSFPVMFSLKMVAGSRQALSDPYAMLISQSTAKALFGQSDPMDKTVRIGNRTDMRIKGVYEDIPDNTNLTGLGFLLAWGNKDNPGDSAQNDWIDHHFGLYVQVTDRADFDKLSARIKDLPNHI
jgi:putative ABC transport system permease protein